MANGKKKQPDSEKTEQADSAAQKEGTQVQVQMDDTDIETVYANFSNVSGTREEFMVDFGMSSVRRTGGTKVSVKLTKRILLSPYTTKRLAQLMNQVVSSYEAKFGTIEITRREDVPKVN